MNKKSKRHAALFFIIIMAFTILATPVFAQDGLGTEDPNAKTQAEIDASNAAVASKQAAEAKAASDAALASQKAASKLAKQRAYFQSQKAASASAAAAAAASSELDSGLLSSDVGVSSEGIQLPSVGDVSGVGGLTDSGTELKSNSSINLWGIISLACIAVSVLIVLAVLFSTTRRPPRGGSGRTRYRKPRRSKKKRLLNDKYYRNMRY